jgi:hypothetical protein
MFPCHGRAVQARDAINNAAPQGFELGEAKHDLKRCTIVNITSVQSDFSKEFTSNPVNEALQIQYNAFTWMP